MNFNEKTMQKTGLVVSLAVFANILWGSAAPMIKLGYELFSIASDDTASQILFAGVRFFIAGFIALGIGSVINGGLLLPKKSSLPKIAVLCLLQTVIQYTLFYIGCANTSGVKVSIAVSTNVFIGIVFSSLLFRLEKFTAKKFAGCVLGFLGVVLINLSSSGGLDLEMSLMGEGFIILSTTSYAMSNVVVKSYSKTENPVMLCAYQFLLGGALMALAGFAFGGRLSFSGFGCIILLIYLAIISGVAFSITSVLMKYNPVSRITVFGFTNPIFGVMLSILVLGESSQDFGLRGVAALLLVCLGVFIVNHNNREQPLSPSPVSVEKP